MFTAASSYLGYAMSEALAEYGANMALTSRNAAKATNQAKAFQAQYSGSFIGVSLDISDPESVNTAVATTIKHFGVIDVLVNNANFSTVEMLHEVSREQWGHGLDGSINGVFNVISATLPHMLSSGSGNIINIASMYGMVPPDYQVYEGTGVPCNPPNYGVGKAGIIQLTKYIACYYAKDGLRANAISPGPFPSAKTQENIEFIHNLEKKAPIKRIGLPEDLKGIIVLLASDASRYINGQNIAVDGGWTSW